MKVIHKYLLRLDANVQAVVMPSYAQIISVQFQRNGHDGLVLWAVVDTDQPSVERRFRAIREAGRAVESAGIDLGTGFGIGEFEEVNQSNDFDCFLAALEELGYGIAATILDAQYFNVAQRRERVNALNKWRLCDRPRHNRTHGRASPRDGREDREVAGRARPATEANC